MESRWTRGRDAVGLLFRQFCHPVRSTGILQGESATKSGAKQQLCAESDPERSEKYKQRARDYVLDLLYYFDDEGESIHQSPL